MSEGQPMVCLPQMLTKSAALRYNSGSTRNRADGLAYWPETVQYFLRTYATEAVILEAIESLESLHQGANET